MNAAKHEQRLHRLEARRQSLRRKLARVEVQIIEVEQQVMVAQKRIDSLTRNQRRAA